MEDTIQKFVKLPAHIRTAVSSPEAIRRLEKIEDTYNLKLADFVMRVTTKELPISHMQSELENAFHLPSEKVQKLHKDLLHNIFSQISNYLGFKPDADPDAGYNNSIIHEGSLGVEHKDAEIEHHASKLKYEDKNDVYDARVFADELLAKNGLSFDHVIQKRFGKLVESRLADVREKADVLDRLTRDSKVGGIGLENQIAQKILNTIEEEHKRIHALNLRVKTDEQKKEAQMPEEVKKETRPTHPPISKQVHPPVVPAPKPEHKPEPEIKPEVKEKPEPPKPSLAPGVDPAPKPEPVPEPPKPAPAFVPPQAPVVPPPTPKPVPTQKQKTDVPHFMPKVLRDQRMAGKPTMSDIKAPSKLIGPIEELKNMSIKDFRRLGESTEESVARIKDMVRKLEKESFERRSEGLKAWRSSELVKEYLEIGQESMEKNMNVNRIISDRQTKGAESMTSDEFDAIATLNRSLRY